jgi:hypothetical protein
MRYVRADGGKAAMGDSVVWVMARNIVIRW